MGTAGLVAMAEASFFSDVKMFVAGTRLAVDPFNVNPSK